MERKPPEIKWRAVLIGGAVAFLSTTVVAVVADALLSEPLLLAATPIGLAAGGAVAGRLARVFGPFQGGMVGVLWVLAEALTDALAPVPRDVISDIAIVVVTDAAHIGLAAFAGWLGARSLR